jgi:hypothetical protein
MPLTFNATATDEDGDPKAVNTGALGVHQFEITKINLGMLPSIDAKKASKGRSKGGSKTGSKGGSKTGSTAGWLTDTADITAEKLVSSLTSSVGGPKKLVLRVPFKGATAPKFQSVLWKDNGIATLRLNILDCLSEPGNQACKPTLVKAVEASGITVDSVRPSHDNDQGLDTKFVDCTLTVKAITEVKLTSR